MSSTAPSAPPPSYEASQGQGDPNKSGNVNAAGYGMYPPPPQSAGYQSAGAQYAPPPQGYPGYQAPPPQGYPGYQAGQAPTQAQPQYADYPEGSYPDEEGRINAFNTSSFSDKAVRHRFIRKVYLILMCQLLFTSALVAIFVSVDSVKQWVRAHSWFYYLAYATFFVTYIALACCPKVRMKFPGNYIALFLFTAMFSYVAAAIASFHNAQAVLIAAGITALVTFSVSMFAVQTKIDFTMCYGLIFAACMTLFFLGIAFIIVWVAIPPGENGKNYYYLQCVYGGIVALILCLMLVYDTQRIVGGKHKRSHMMSANEYILGALELYMDIIYLFITILGFFKE